MPGFAYGSAHIETHWYGRWWHVDTCEREADASEVISRLSPTCALDRRLRRPFLLTPISGLSRDMQEMPRTRRAQPRFSRPQSPGLSDMHLRKSRVCRTIPGNSSRVDERVEDNITDYPNGGIWLSEGCRARPPTLAPYQTWECLTTWEVMASGSHTSLSLLTTTRLYWTERSGYLSPEVPLAASHSKVRIYLVRKCSIGTAAHVRNAWLSALSPSTIP